MPRWILRHRFLESQVSVTWQESTRRIEPMVEHAIDEAWARVTARPGVHLYDGPVCRLESYEQHDGHLTLRVSKTSYRIVVGTNFEHPHFVDQYGVDVMANPIGVSAGVISGDGRLLLGRRNASVAYYPNRVHPFAGSLEVRERINLWDEVRREIREELRLDADALRSIEMVGLVEDQKLRHPESVFLVRTELGSEAIRESLDPAEHDALIAIPLDERSLEDASDDPALTPVARAVVDAAYRS